MTENEKLDRIAISVRSHRLLRVLLRENPMLETIIIESKSIHEYLRQMEDMGEEPGAYEGLFGYSIGQTEPRVPIYEYPEYSFGVTKELSNIEV